MTARAKLLLVAFLSGVVGAALAMRPPAFQPDDGAAVTVAAAWCVAASLSFWLALASTVGCISARTLPLTPRSVRHLIEVALVGSCIVGSAVPASATSSPVVRDVPVVRAPAPRLQHRHPRPKLEAPPRTHIVEPGENLWSIAESVAGRNNLLPYWRALVAQNDATLRSGDPNLIFPGEILTLPAQ